MAPEEQSEHLALALQQRIASRDFRIPVLPDIAWKVMRITNDPESNLTQLVNVVQSEQVLAASVLRVANSAAFSRGMQIVNLPQAITRLGMTLVRDIAFATAVNARMFDAAVFDRQIRQISVHALATALWAKEIALVAKRNAETAFLCGLLHSIGKPILLRATLDTEGFDRAGVDVDALMARIDRLHTEAAAIALDRWKIPLIVSEAVLHQYNPNVASQGKGEARIIQAARKLASFTLTGEPERGEIETLSVFPALEISSEQVEKLFTKQGHVRTTLEAIRG